MGFGFVVFSALLGVGLAMDAFSVSLANGLNDRTMRGPAMVRVAGVFAAFQFAMPLIGWLCVHTVASAFTAFQVFIPWIALALLGYIGGKMLYEGIKGGDADEGAGSGSLGFKALMIQGVATSIDALSVGFTIADYGAGEALLCCFIVGLVTWVICLLGLLLGRTFGTKLAGKASILGGVILIAIGIEIFVTGTFF